MRLHYLFEVAHAFASITRAYVMQSDGVSCKRQLQFRPLGPVVKFSDRLNYTMQRSSPAERVKIEDDPVTPPGGFIAVQKVKREDGPV